MTNPTTESGAKLEVVDKLKSIPVVEEACRKSAGVYHTLKGSNQLVNWALESAEGILGTAVGVVTPIATRSGVDSKLCQGIEIIEQKVPIVKEQPHEIYKKAKDYVSSNVSDLQSKSVNLADRSWQTANHLLTTPLGYVALTGFDKTSKLADNCIDYYLPPIEGESDYHTHMSTECEDKVLHTIHTIGTLSHKVGTRVYRSLSHHFSERPRA